MTQQRARRSVPAVPASLEDDIRPPAAFSSDEKRVWKEELDYLRELGFVAPSDLSIFTLYVQVKARRDRMARELNGDFVYTTPTGIERTKEQAKIMFAAEKRMESLQTKLGFSPISRLAGTRAHEAVQGDLFPPHRAQMPKETPKGKKELAAEEAVTAGQDTEWGDDLKFNGGALH